MQPLPLNIPMNDTLWWWCDDDDDDEEEEEEQSRRTWRSRGLLKKHYPDIHPIGRQNDEENCEIGVLKSGTDEDYSVLR